MPRNRAFSIAGRQLGTPSSASLPSAPSASSITGSSRSITAQLQIRLEEDRQIFDVPPPKPPEIEAITFRSGNFTNPQGDEVTPRILSSGGVRNGERLLFVRRVNIAVGRGR